MPCKFVLGNVALRLDFLVVNRFSAAFIILHAFINSFILSFIHSFIQSFFTNTIKFQELRAPLDSAFEMTLHVGQAVGIEK